MQPHMPYDLLIRHGTVVDGSGTAPVAADVDISGDRIVAVGRLEGATAATVIDARGKVVCPGFIDVHVHSETALLHGAEPDRYGGVLQGVTTHLTAPDGFGWAPLPATRARALWEYTRFAHDHAGLTLHWPTAAAYLALFPGRTPANIVPQVPHCAVRLAVLGWKTRPATADELERMAAVVREWAEAGAVALAVGLDCQPSATADTPELVELSKVVRQDGGLYAAHQRYGALGEVAAWRETMEIGRRAGIPVHVNHTDVTEATAPLLEEAARDCDLTFDSYLYPAGCTHLAALLPSWAHAGGPEGLRRRLRHRQVRARLYQYVQRRLSEAATTGARPVFAANQTGRYIGQSLFEAAAAVDQSPAEFVLRTLEEEHPYALLVYHRETSLERQHEIMRRTMQHPAMVVASDGIYHGSLPHPRAWGCFARVLRLCVRELGVVRLEQAVYKMSGLPAQRFRIKDRGLLRAGYGADVVIFDPERVGDCATCEEPRRAPAGIDRVIVNGETVVLQGKPTGRLSGRVL